MLKCMLAPQPDDLAALLEAVAAVFEVDAELWLDESLRYPILGQVRGPRTHFAVCAFCTAQL